MKRLLAKAAALLIGFYLLLMLAVRVVMPPVTPDDNIRVRYAAYMPGQSFAALKECDNYFLSVLNSNYITCTPEDGYIRFVRITGRNGLIVETWLYPAAGAVYLPDAIGWFGRWQRFYGRGDWRTVRFAGVVVGMWKWHGMRSEVSVLDFKGGE